MHIALTSRDAELEYLEELSKRLLPLVIKVIKDYYYELRFLCESTSNIKYRNLAKFFDINL